MVKKKRVVKGPNPEDGPGTLSDEQIESAVANVSNRKRDVQLQIAYGAADTIRALMDAQGISQRDLADATDKSVAYVNQVLHPGSPKRVGSSTYTSAPSIDTYQNFAGYLGVELDVQVTSKPKPDAGRLVPRRTKGGKKDVH